MILLDKPYVSDYLKNTIVRNRFPVLRTELSEKLFFPGKVNLVSENDAVEILSETIHPLIYTNSENSINWLINNLQNSDLSERISLFKDKVSFRKLLKGMYPDFFFKEVSIHKIDSLDINILPKPFVIKPSKGFFSMGVHIVNSNDEWVSTKKLILSEIEYAQGLYPTSVLDNSTFIIEEYIQGEEFAFDGYFNSQGKPVILNIFKHLFKSESDYNDRVYFTSIDLIADHHTNFKNFLSKLSDLNDLKNFPMHIELRIQKNGNIIPVEINPMRFGGWCTTADLTQFAYNFNPYEYYFLEKEPNWDEIAHVKNNKLYSIVVLDNTTGKKVEDIDFFNYEKLLKEFENPIELRKISYKEYPVFGFLFTETSREKLRELNSILESNLSEFIELHK